MNEKLRELRERSPFKKKEARPPSEKQKENKKKFTDFCIQSNLDRRTFRWEYVQLNADIKRLEWEAGEPPDGWEESEVCSFESE